MDKNRIIFLLEKYSQRETTIAEENELFAIVNQCVDDSVLQHELTKVFEEAEPVYLTTAMRERILAKIFTPNSSDIAGIEILSPPKGKKATIRSMFSGIRAVAASIVLVMGVGIYFLFFSKAEKQNVLVKTTVSHDVEAPGNNRAMIILDNGERMFLDSVGNGTLTTQGNVTVVKTADGKIVYNQKSGGASQVMQYHTMFNPRGSKVQPLTLSDGTRVWLNSESSVRYPIAFTGSERKVEITGEAFFEVAKNAAMPFKVKKANNDTEVQVLGTHFNINAYDDEETIEVTLIEGSVQMKKGNEKQMLIPGQQAQVNVTGNIKVLNNVDVETVMAWKNGMFVMDKANIGSIMRQIARWYDVDIVYENGEPEGTLSGEVPRSFTLSQVLKVLEYSGVHSAIDGKRIIVKA